MRPRSGAFFWIRQRKVWSSSSLDGLLNDTTDTPWGFTPDITCSMVESLPAASIAWNTTSTEWVSLAHRSSCASLSRLMPRWSTSLAAALSSFFDSDSYSPTPAHRVGRPSRSALVPGATRRSARIRRRWSGLSGRAGVMGRLRGWRGSCRRRTSLVISSTTIRPAASSRQTSHWPPVSEVVSRIRLQDVELGGQDDGDERAAVEGELAPVRDDVAGEDRAGLAAGAQAEGHVHQREHGDGHGGGHQRVGPAPRTRRAPRGWRPP